MTLTERRMVAEWERQRCVLMSFPHEHTDWHDLENPASLNDALSPFIRIAQAIAYKEAVYIICQHKKKISSMFCSTKNMTFIEIPTNDTWIRDYGYISIEEDGKTKLLNFVFDGWGGKFEAELDNSVNTVLHQKGYMGITPLEHIDFVLEGGSIESDGKGTILTTSQCLCNPNRNGGSTKEEAEYKLKEYLGAKRILWLDYGYLAGDDTDGHIDTLARFTDEATIAYVQCEDSEDEHYHALKAMEEQLRSFRQQNGKPYKLVPLPMCEAKYDKEGKRLPATYANFLITNDALVFPTYSDDHNDSKAEEALRALFPGREMIPVNCLKLIEEGGSLHCSTMQVAY
ncbi:agmatine deiminase family protein [Sulfurovum sp. NBC37-1]|uniref:agmatine deiminase family protein n=1 Tax=Sulfurovum sp. (strain NBC37-1) TaxID=387093 RepID=UPI0001587B86|nr:agmatine deiminase family protein [Sulfurovum sp. NBC37-1]BAF73064.1 peptidyl-arginine deiminase family protein [Sulfurovum sp. NBC37-1]